MPMNTICSVVKKSNSAKAVLIAVFRQTSHSQDPTQPEHCQCCKLGHHLTYANHVVPTGTTVTTNPVDWVIYKTRGFFFLASSTTFWFCGPCLFCLLLLTLCLWLLWFKLLKFYLFLKPAKQVSKWKWEGKEKEEQIGRGKVHLP